MGNEIEKKINKMTASAEVGEIVEEKGQNSEDQTQELKFSFTYKYYKNPTEFIIIEIRDNWLRYQNSARYRNEMKINRQVLLRDSVIEYLRDMAIEAKISEIEIDSKDKWNKHGTQYITVQINDEKYSFEFMKIMSILEASKCASDIEHIKNLHYYSKNMIQFLISVIQMHFNENPFQNALDTE